MTITNIHFIDSDKVKHQFKKICEENGFRYKDIAPSIGYQPETLARYMHGKQSSAYITLALIEKFHMKEEDIIKETFKCEK